MFEHVRPGQNVRPRAPVWNAMLDAARAHQGRREDLGPQSALEGPAPSLVVVKNTTGQDLARGSILGLGLAYPVVDPQDQEADFVTRPVLAGTVPAPGYDSGMFCVLAEPLADGAIGPAYVRGVVAVKVDVADTSHWQADPAENECDHLDSRPAGTAKILWKESPWTTGVMWTICLLGSAEQGFWAELGEEAEAGGGCYSWSGQMRDASTATGFTGTDNLYEVNGVEGLPAGLMVWVWPDPYDPTTFHFQSWPDPREAGGPGGVPTQLTVRYAVDEGTHNPVTVSDADWRGRTLAWSMAQELAVEAGICDDLDAWEVSGTSLGHAYIASRCTSEQNLQTFSPADGGSARLYVDGGDGGKLKIEFSDIPDGGGGEGSYGWNLVLSVLAWAWTGEGPLGGGWIEVP